MNAQEGTLDAAAGGRSGAATGHAAFAAMHKFDSLDGLRAISVAAVVWHHAGASAFAGWARYAGAEGVTLFFAISGFLITTLLLREHDRHGHVDLRAFYIRRALRIFPLYFGVLLIYVALVAVMERHSAEGQAFFRNLVYFATYTSNWFVPLDGRVIFYFSWSLAAEEQFYALWPPILKWLRTQRRAIGFIAGACGVLFLLEMATRMAEPGALDGLRRFVAGVPMAIVFGVAFALLLHSRAGFERLAPLLCASRWHCLGWLALVVAATAVNWLPRTVMHLAFACLVASCVMRADHVLAPCLRWRPIAYVGSISYGIYMLHMLAKNAVVELASFAGVALGPGALFMLALATAIVAAAISFRYFESYFLTLKHRYAR